MAKDTFTAADTTLLSDHDARWAGQSAYPISTLHIVGGTVQQNANWKESVAYWAEGAARWDQSSQVVVRGKSTAGTANHLMGPTVRASASSGGYEARLAIASGDNWTNVVIYKDRAYLANVAITPDPFSQLTDHTLKIEATGSGPVTLEVWLDGVSLGTRSDASTPIVDGYPGFRLNGAVLITELRLDDWEDETGAAETIPEGSPVSAGVASSAVIGQKVSSATTTASSVATSTATGQRISAGQATTTAVAVSTAPGQKVSSGSCAVLAVVLSASTVSKTAIGTPTTTAIATASAGGEVVIDIPQGSPSAAAVVVSVATGQKIARAPPISEAVASSKSTGVKAGLGDATTMALAISLAFGQNPTNLVIERIDGKSIFTRAVHKKSIFTRALSGKSKLR